MKPMRTLKRGRMSPHHQKGVGMIEVLVAVLVVSIGFLGVAGLQVMALSTNNDAMASSMATVSSYSILDAMRADRTNALDGIYNATVDASECPAKGATMASQQLWQWCGQLGKALGDSGATTGKIACTADGDCTVTITYKDGRNSESDSQQLVTRAVL